MDNHSHNQGLIFARRLGDSVDSHQLDWADMERWSFSEESMWIHLNRTYEKTEQWLRKNSGLQPTTVDALLSPESRPRVFHSSIGLVVIVRGVNLNPGCKTEEMIDLRLWSDGKRIITLRDQPLQSVQDVLSLLEQNNHSATVSELFEQLITRVVERIAPSVESIDDNIDRFEAVVNSSHKEANAIRRELMELRSQALQLRRYLSPQRIALSELLLSPPHWADDHWKAKLRESTDNLLRYLEELDMARERALIIKDDIANQLAEANNKTLYILAIISSIFLPLGFLTGLFGVNIGGMPGIGNTHAFWEFSVTLVALTGFQLFLFKRLNWL